MAMSTWKLERECMDCHKREYSPTNSSRNAWRVTVTLNNPTLLVCGNISHAPFGLTYVWMILACGSSARASASQQKNDVGCRRVFCGQDGVPMNCVSKDQVRHGGAFSNKDDGEPQQAYETSFGCVWAHRLCSKEYSNGWRI